MSVRKGICKTCSWYDTNGGGCGYGVVDMTVPMAACEYRNRKRGRF